MTEFTTNARMAEKEMRSLFEVTPLQRNDLLSKRYDADIWLKREDLSPVRSYKIRGAFNAMRKVIAKDPTQKMFVCASAGNHAQGVAFACRHFGVHGVIFMPVTTPQQKIEKTKVFGGAAVDIRLVGDYFDESLHAAQAYCDDIQGHFLPPFDDADVIEGQATIAVEMLRQLGGVPDLIVLPVGGGGLSAGLVAYMQDTMPQVGFKFIEPEGGTSLKASLEDGDLVTLDAVSSFVDGAAVARIGAQNYEILKSVDPTDVLSVNEDRICTTIIEMLNHEGVVLEPAGALSVDALKDMKDEIKGKTVVCITSGGNFDFERLPEVKERAQRYGGFKKYFILRLPQRPGALKEFLSILGPEDDIARFEYLKKSARNFGSVLIGIETVDPKNFKRLLHDLDQAGFQFRDITTDESIAEFIL
ncbi:MAG: threonine ammonia-lyase IlvA [Halocynthiibacter sp.]